ncbi:MAG TPA: adenylosuccinate synthase [Patescibacteria group bacterium]
MSVTLVIGSQWGDEGKGKIIDFLSEHSDYVIRYHGGNNAGHTVINKYGKFPLHLVPSGIFSKKAKAFITNGTVLDLDVLLGEIEMLEKAGFRLKNKLFISPRCNIIMPYHKILEKVYESAKGKAKVGSTGRGIGPVYADKVSYNGIRILDLLDKKQFSERLKVQLLVKNKVITALGEKALRQSEVEKHFFGLIKKLKPFLKEPFPLIQKGLKDKKEMLGEGAQGVFLDNDWGTYPFVTASTTLSGGITGGAGIAPNHITNVLGVVKAYTTRVGSGPFPTELFDKDGELLRKEGAEFGTTTGRPRRCGWFDIELIKFAAEINGFTGIAITKLDVLDKFKKIKICTGYTYKGKKVRYYDIDAYGLEKVKPIYQTLPGWEVSTAGITSFEKLPIAAQKYLETLEKNLGVPIRLVSTGPERDAIIVK